MLVVSHKTTFKTDRQLARFIGRRIQALRKTRGLTSEKLAYENDMSKSYLSRIENGKRLPTFSFLNKLAKALDYELWQFFVNQAPTAESFKPKKGRAGPKG